VKKLDETNTVNILTELKDVPERKLVDATRRRANFLLEAAAARQALPLKKKATLLKSAGLRLKDYFAAINMRPLKPAVVAIIVVVLLLVSSSVTVYASQSSTPDQLIYPVKILSEDTVLALTSSPQTRMDYLLKFSERRILEMQKLAARGHSIPNSVVLRNNNELQQALSLAANMDNQHLEQWLAQIQTRIELQLDDVNSLLANTPDNDQPELLQARSDLEQDIQLCMMGKSDPSGFRLRFRGQQQHQNQMPTDENLNLEYNPITPTPEGSIPTGTMGGYGGGSQNGMTSSGTVGPGYQNGPGPNSTTSVTQTPNSTVNTPGDGNGYGSGGNQGMQTPNSPGNGPNP
jgi:hypothetical protein